MHELKQAVSWGTKAIRPRDQVNGVRPGRTLEARPGFNFNVKPSKEVHRYECCERLDWTWNRTLVRFHFIAGPRWLPCSNGMLKSSYSRFNQNPDFMCIHRLIMSEKVLQRVIQRDCVRFRGRVCTKMAEAEGWLVFRVDRGFLRFRIGQKWESLLSISVNYQKFEALAFLLWYYHWRKCRR